MKKCKQLLTSVLILLLSVSFFSCFSSTEDKDKEIDDFTGNNGYGIISGDPIGSGITPVSELRKEIPITYNAGEYDGIFQVSSVAYVTQESADYDFGYVLFEMTNISDRSYSFIELVDVKIKDSIGNALNDDDYIFLIGSTGQYEGISDFGYTNTCLAPGETGYVAVLYDIDFDAIASIEFAIDPYFEFNENPDNPEGNLVPVQYTVTSISDYWEYGYFDIEVLVKNEGSRAVYIGDFSEIILLDSSGKPLLHNFLTEIIAPTDSYVAPMATGSVGYGYFTYDGQSTKMKVFLDFDYAETKKRGEFSSNKEYVAYKSKQRNKIEKQKKNSIIK